MLNSFRKTQETRQPLQANPETGEIVTKQTGAQIFNVNKNRSVKEIAGELPPVLNLKEHPELDGQLIAIIGKPSIKSSTFDEGPGQYILFPAVLLSEPNEAGECKPGALIAIMTGSENVTTRVIALGDVPTPETPVIGRLRAAGRAWLLE